MIGALFWIIIFMLAYIIPAKKERSIVPAERIPVFRFSLPLTTAPIKAPKLTPVMVPTKQVKIM